MQSFVHAPSQGTAILMTTFHVSLSHCITFLARMQKISDDLPPPMKLRENVSLLRCIHGSILCMYVYIHTASMKELLSGITERWYGSSVHVSVQGVQQCKKNEFSNVALEISQVVASLHKQEIKSFQNFQLYSIK